MRDDCVKLRTCLRLDERSILYRSDDYPVTESRVIQPFSILTAVEVIIMTEMRIRKLKMIGLIACYLIFIS